jgi:protoporphyrin/coproporphyrin ferrochelatase
MSRIAVVLFNLGGPSALDTVRPFLRNLFSDPAIIPLPALLRAPLAELISRTRERSAQAAYAHMGGASPLAAETARQAEALSTRLNELLPDDEVRVFTAMRYWTPVTANTAQAVNGFSPNDVVLLPLYPQYSTTTTASSFLEWERIYGRQGRQHGVCCYFDEPAFIEAHATLIERTWASAGKPGPVRLLFSAHGLPERTSAAGDPYRWQVEQTATRVAERLSAGWDWRVCYQSRVGPMKWIGPSTIEEIERAAADGVGVVIAPIAFVSEHVETLVELDRDYAALAHKLGVTPYIRVPALRTEPAFIEALARLAVTALGADGALPGASRCKAGFSRCPQSCREAAA